MARRSDARQRMVEAAKQLIRQRGYEATAFSDVLQLSEAPRGSVYFHFPGGKVQLAMAVAEAHAHDQVVIIDQAAEQAGSAAELIERYLDLGRDGMVASDYARGCGIAPLVIDGAGRDSTDVAETSRRTFAQMIDRLAFHFIVLGMDQAAARVLADAVMAGVEGAMVTARALRSPTPFDAVRAALVSLAASGSPRVSRRNNA
ncbi:TetR/AcrR family transcriptional regulator [Micromonospora sp. CA-269861]|uniref:TetR/AcrR family transcriptional regulator n=1 Tax=Micromonospora sp. CA-269861 TaxID=3239968 RepID=UPI003D90D3F1